MSDIIEDVVCTSCGGSGRWQTECCDGSGGCDCRGEVIEMGQCNVCGGVGRIAQDTPLHQLEANRRAIAGLSFIGRGPSTGLWAGHGKRGNLIP